MNINIDKVNSIIKALIIIIVVAGGLACIWLNDAQRIIVGIAMVLAVINLLGMRFFFNKNKGKKK